MKFNIFYVYLLASCLLPVSLLAQSPPSGGGGGGGTPPLELGQDCETARIICSNIYHEKKNYAGGGTTGGLTGGICGSSTLDANRMWYTFTIQKSGQLEFTIVPNNPLANFDFALFEAENCNGIINGNVLRCNYSGKPGKTGLQAGFLSNSEGPSSVITFSAPVNVVKGETYYLLISSDVLPGTPEGYDIDFSKSNVVLEDNAPPEIVKANFIEAGCTTKVHVEFSEPVIVPTIIPSTIANELRIAGPDNINMSVTSIAWDYSSTGSSKARGCTLSIIPALIYPGDYNLLFEGILRDGCGNLMEMASFPISHSLMTSLPLLTVENTTDACNVQSFRLCIPPNSSYTSLTLYKDGKINQVNAAPSPSTQNCFFVKEFGTYSVQITGGGGCAPFSTSIVVD